MLVDTSVWIDFFNGYDSPEANRLTLAITEGEPIALTGLVLTEILLGLKSDREADRIAELLTAFEFVSEPTLADYSDAARLYRTCRAQGFTIRSTIDCVIAQVAIRDHRPLLTKDRDFATIAQVTTLELLPIT